MLDKNAKALITTRPEHCRVCYTCVRECPAKAIRVTDGQAEVMPDRCIVCGNCVRVCSQNAKQVASSMGAVLALLAEDEPVAAIVAPSFPAEFTDLDPGMFVGTLRAMGFTYVNEVAFGADLVARAYHDMLAENSQQQWIGTTCPAIVSYVQRYHPDLVDKLAPIVSPMIASARTLRQMHGDDLRIVFIGPCIAKKGEAADEAVYGDVDECLTFAELQTMFRIVNFDDRKIESSDFDPPHGKFGALFPISGGMVQAAGLDEDLVDAEILSVQGGHDFVEAFKEFETGSLNVRLLEPLACRGCIMGPGMSPDTPFYARRERVSTYVRDHGAKLPEDVWNRSLDEFEDVALYRGFKAHDRRLNVPSDVDLERIMHKMGKFDPSDELDCGACGYPTCREHAVAVHKGLAETEMCLPYSIEKLRSSLGKLAKSKAELERTQDALRHSEKLASMGQLAAGIAHELNNPLAVVLMYAHILLEENEGKEEMSEDLAMISQQADRCKKIVGNLLRFARQNKVELADHDLTEVVRECLRILPPPAGSHLEFKEAAEPLFASFDQDQIAQVLTNLVGNAYAAMPNGGTVTVETGGNEDTVWIRVADTGVGIPEEQLSKVFEPFYTTKDVGEGTGLGLSVTYGIVKMHRGDIRVESNVDPNAGPTGTAFTVTLPRESSNDAEANESSEAMTTEAS
jgi:iron only hydrogenase large subunit-like protein/nitrogen-specific signal transduction histidine kinase